MRDSNSNRSVVFRQAYWARVEELVDLTDHSSRQRAVAAAQAAKLGRRRLRRFSDAARTAPDGPFSIEAVDRVAKRYGLWETRRVFDRGNYPTHVRPETRRLDEALYGGIYELDVTLRRKVEAVLRSPLRDGRDVEALGSAVEATAGRLAAAVDLSAVADQHHPNWSEIHECFNAVCDELDNLLDLAGAAPAG
jgi:hypothetical protein